MTGTPAAAPRGSARRIGVRVASVGAILAVVLAAYGIAAQHRSATTTPAAGPVGMVPAAPGPTPTPTETAPAQEVATPSQASTRSVYTPPPAPAGVDRSTDSVAASTQAAQAAQAALLGWMHYDSAEGAAQREARLAVLFTPSSTLVTEAAPLSVDSAANCVSAGRISFAEPTGTQTDTTGQFAIGVTWSIAAWPDAAGGTSTQSGTDTAVVDVVLEGGRWLAESIDAANSR